MGIWLLPATCMISAIVACLVAMALWATRKGKWLACMMVGVCVWSMGAAMVMASFDNAHKQFWLAVETLGIVSSPVFLFLFALTYNGMDRLMPRGFVVGLFVMPATTLVLAATNPWHGWVWSGFERTALSPWLVVLQHGPWWPIGIVGYPYTLIGTSLYLFAWAAWRLPQPYRAQAVTFLLALAIPMVVSIVYVTGHSPLPGWDPGPQAMAVTGILVAWNLSRNQVGELTPVARDAVVERMKSGVLMLNEANRVVDANPAARRILALPDDCIGQDVTRVVPKPWNNALDPSVAPTPTGEDASWETTIGDATDRYLELSISALRDKFGRVTGRLVIARDVTTAKVAEIERERVVDQLQQALAEVKTLGGLLPICSYCKKIRDDSGYWTRIESYIQSHSDASFTHGMCPDCLAKFQKEFHDSILDSARAKAAEACAEPNSPICHCHD